MSIVCTLRNCS